jgi:hypothetical protein
VQPDKAAQATGAQTQKTKQLLKSCQPRMKDYRALAGRPNPCRQRRAAENQINRIIYRQRK